MTLLFFVFHLGVGDRGVTDRAPVDDAGALINIALFMHADKGLFDGSVAALVHGKTLAVPVAGGAQFFQLFDNRAAVLFFPFPGAFQKFFATKRFFINPLAF